MINLFLFQKQVFLLKSSINLKHLENEGDDNTKYAVSIIIVL